MLSFNIRTVCIYKSEKRDKLKLPGNAGFAGGRKGQGCLSGKAVSSPLSIPSAPAVPSVSGPVFWYPGFAIPLHLKNAVLSNSMGSDSFSA